MNDAPSHYSPVTVHVHGTSTYQVRLENRTDRRFDSIIARRSLAAAMAEVARWANRKRASYRVVLRVPQSARVEAESAVAQFNAAAQPPCTIVVACMPEVARCGAPSARTWTSSIDGARLAECAAHAHP